MGSHVARHGDKEMTGAEEGAVLRLVTPGEAIGASSGVRAGTGTLKQGNEIISTKLGWAKENNGVVFVDPIYSAYLPRSGDLVIGIVESVRNNLWFAEVNGPFNGLLPMSLAPWKVEFGAAREHMDIGDVMLARVQEVDEAHNIVITMKGVGLRKLKEGTVLDLPVNLVKLVRSDNDSILNSLKEASDCRIIVADNGRMWVDGSPENISMVRDAIDLLRSSGHMSNVTDVISQFVEERRNE